MFADVPAAVEAIGRILIAVLFFHQGYFAMTERYAFHTERLRSRHFPMPHIALAIGFTMMFIGAASVMLNIYTTVGGILLLVFSVVATVAYQNFWSFKDPARRAEKRASFMYNLGVIGGILMVIARAQT